MTTHLPLDDIRVIDLTVARAGPTCVRQLADWGADVIRVEPPPDPSDPGLTGSRHGCDFQHLHRNKRSPSLNLKTPDGREALMRLVDTADVLIENMRPPVKERLGFDFATVHARNPRLVYGSISGFGEDGPYAVRGGVDQIAQGMGGLMSVTGLPGGGPVRAGIPVADLAAGLYLAVGVLVALHDRERKALGADLPAGVHDRDDGFPGGQVDHRPGGPAAGGQPPPAERPDGLLRLVRRLREHRGAGGRLLDSLCQVIGLPGIPADPRLDSATKRSANRVELNELIAGRLRTRTTAEWVQALNEAGVPCGPVYRMDEVFADPQVEHLAMTEPVQHPALGRLEILRNAVRMTDAPATVRSPSPDNGDHTDEVLTELGYPRAEIDSRAQGAI